MAGSFLLVLFVFIVAAANLSVGFAAAVCLGVGPPQWRRFQLRRKDKLSPAPDSAETPDDLPEASAEEPAVDEPTAATEPEESDTEMLEAPPDEHPLSQVLAQLGRSFDRFESELAEWDRRRRAEVLDGDGLTNSAIDLNNLASGYLEQFQSALDPLAYLRTQDAAALAAREETTACATEASAQLRAVCAELGSLQFHGDDATAGAEKLHVALTQVLAVLHAARNRLEEPVVKLLGSAVHEPALAATLRENAAASLLGRLCFEQQWHAHDEQRSTGESAWALMLDVDGLQALNASHGPLIACRALLAVGEVAGEVLPLGSSLARVQGQQFALLLTDPSLEKATEMAERLRQEIAHTRLMAIDNELQLTVSAAVVRLAAADTSHQLLQRLRTAISAAKAHGRNCTFVDDDATPALVPPLSLHCEARVLPL